MKENQKPAYVFTSESVTEGHPDKMADQFADSLLDAILSEDPDARTAIEATLSNGLIHVFGEVSTKADVDYKRVIKSVIYDIGYCADELSTEGEFCRILIQLNKQSPDIAMGVDGENQGAGDQGVLIGYATDETPEFMPLPLVLSHKLCKRLAEARKSGLLPYLKPDGKAQVSIGYGKDNKPLSIEAIVVSTQHAEGVDIKKLREDVTKYIILKVIPHELLTERTKVMINPTGRFVLGGPAADSGLTGRKIIVDTYGSKGRHGGGSFSGKDPTKVDRSASYMARHIAKNIVAAGIATECEIEIAYAIGIAKPVSLLVNTFGTGKIDDLKIAFIVNDLFDLRPKSIIEYLDLRRPIYKKTAAYGHFGREDEDFTWEKTDKAESLKEQAGLQ